MEYCFGGIRLAKSSHRQLKRDLTVIIVDVGMRLSYGFTFPRPFISKNKFLSGFTLLCTLPSKNCFLDIPMRFSGVDDDGRANFIFLEGGGDCIPPSSTRM